MGRMNERRIDGQTYTLHLSTHTKTVGKTEASRLRKNGWNVRVIPLEKNYYGLFARRKK